METVHKLETTVASWYKGAPHLPKAGREWLGKNVWWIVLIGVVLSVFWAVTAISGLLFAGAVLTSVGGAYGVYGGYASQAVALGGQALLAGWLAIIALVAEVVLGGLAIAPLKNGKKKGWTLLFVSVLLQAVLAVVTFVFTFSLGSLLGGALGVVVGLYFLFEIRDQFGVASAAHHAAPAKHAKKA